MTEGPNMAAASAAAAAASTSRPDDVQGLMDDLEGLDLLQPGLGNILEEDGVLNSIAREILSQDFEIVPPPAAASANGALPPNSLVKREPGKDLSGLDWGQSTALPQQEEPAVLGALARLDLGFQSQQQHGYVSPGKDMSSNLDWDVGMLESKFQPPLVSPDFSSGASYASGGVSPPSYFGASPPHSAGGASSSVGGADYASGEEEAPAAAKKSADKGLCEICSCQASEYKYYGARSCQSCRAFFRRAVQKPGGYQSLKCRSAKKGGAAAAAADGTNSGDKCKIDSQSWRSCRYCRFQKCLSAGMNPKWVLNDAEKRRRAERLAVIKKEKDVAARATRAQSSAAVDPLALQQPRDLVTQEEVDSINQLAMARMGVFSVELRKFFYSNLGRFQRISAYKDGRSAIPVDDLRTFDALFAHLHSKFVEESIDCSSISPGDKQILLRNNCKMLVSIGHSMHVNVDGENAIVVGKAIDAARESFQRNPGYGVGYNNGPHHHQQHYPTGAYYNANTGYYNGGYHNNGYHASHSGQEESLHHQVEEALSPFYGLFLSGGRGGADTKLTYEQFYPPSWVGNAELERRHKENGAKVGAWFEGSPDHIMFFLLSMIIIFSSTFLELEAPQEVERAQLTYARALHRYLRRKVYKDALKNRSRWQDADDSGGAAAKKLGDGMMILSLARESQKIKELGRGRDYDSFEQLLQQQQQLQLACL